MKKFLYWFIDIPQKLVQWNDSFWGLYFWTRQAFHFITAFVICGLPTLIAQLFFPASVFMVLGITGGVIMCSIIIFEAVDNVNWWPRYKSIIDITFWFLGFLSVFSLVKVFACLA